MDTAIEDIIKNIIHIDKRAVQLRGDLEKELDARKKQVDAEILKLKNEIVEGQREKMMEIEEQKLQEALREAEAIRQESQVKCADLLRKYDYVKDKLIMELFNGIFLNGN